MGRRRPLVFAILLSLGALFAVAMPTAASAEQQLPVELQGNPACNLATGTWDVTYFIRNYSPVDMVVDSAADPVSGQSFTPTSPTVESWGIAVINRSAPGSTTQLALVVRLHRVDHPVTIVLDQTSPLPSGCAAQPSGAPCVNPDAARYRHTFDAATGTATVQLVGPPLCPGQYESLELVSRTDEQTYFRDPYDEDGGFLTSGYSALVFHVNLPPCHAHVFMFFDVPYGHPVDDPSLMLGASTFPGNRSTGPLADAWVNGASCTSAASAYLTSNCDGTMSFHLSNAASANVSTEVKFEEAWQNYVELYREVVLEPGESAVVTVRPPHPDGVQQVWWHDNIIAQGMYAQAYACVAPAVPRPRPARTHAVPEPLPSNRARPSVVLPPSARSVPAPHGLTAPSISPSPAPPVSPTPSP